MAAIQRAATTELAPPGETSSDRLDRVLTHRVWGTIIFLAVMTLMFQGIFFFARLPMDALQTGVDWLGHAVGSLIPPGDLNSLLVDGVIAGVPVKYMLSTAGWCHRFPPCIREEPRSRIEPDRFPVVDAGYWCGEFKD